MDGNIFDIFGIPVQEIPEGAVLQWDGCRWTLVELPGDVLLCDDIVDCVQGELDNIWAAVHNKIGCSDLASCAVIGSLQDQINNLPASVIDQVKFYINTVNDGQTSTYANEDTITIYGLDGLRFLTNPSTGVHELRLPSGANDWDVLVWRDSMNGASWETIEDCLCNQIATCPSITALENMYTGLQNQVNYLLGLDPSDQPVLTCSDVARCIWAGTTDVDHAMAEWIINWIEWEGLQTLLTTIQNEIDTILIRNCNDVMACEGIQTLGNVQSQLVVRMDDAEGEIAAIWPALNAVTSTVATHTGLITALENAVTELQGQASTNVINTCADVMACDGIQGLLTGYTQLNTIVGDHVGEISALWTAVNPLVSTVGNFGGRITALEADVLTLQGHITSDAILTCNDVMACSGILGLVSDMANLDGRVTAIENCCGSTFVQLDETLITDNLKGLVFTNDFIVEEVVPGTVVVAFNGENFISHVDNAISDIFMDSLYNGALTYWNSAENKLTSGNIFQFGDGGGQVTVTDFGGNGLYFDEANFPRQFSGGVSIRGGTNMGSLRISNSTTGVFIDHSGFYADEGIVHRSMNPKAKSLYTESEGIGGFGMFVEADGNTYFNNKAMIYMDGSQNTFDPAMGGIRFGWKNQNGGELVFEKYDTNTGAWTEVHAIG